MAKLIYAAITSLDLYIEDEQGEFGWAAPDDELFAAVNDLERRLGTYLYGRRMYETMLYWETFEPGVGADSALAGEFAQIWKAAEKIVYSRSLASASSARTRFEREFDPQSVRALKQAAGRDISVGGAELAGHALAAELVDECHLFLMPLLVGGGKRALPDSIKARLRLLDERRFTGGAVHLRYGLER